MHWKQFSLYPPGCRNKFFPLQVLHTFLPKFIESVKPHAWHVLFEPSALVRFVADDTVLSIGLACEIAGEMGLECELGDSSSEFQNLKWPGVDYYGESEIYGDDLWNAMVKFLQAISELALEISRLNSKTQLVMTKKVLHLLLNSFGLNYLEQAIVCKMSADRFTELSDEFYRV